MVNETEHRVHHGSFQEVSARATLAQAMPWGLGALCKHPPPIKRPSTSLVAQRVPIWLFDFTKASFVAGKGSFVCASSSSLLLPAWVRGASLSCYNHLNRRNSVVLRSIAAAAPVLVAAKHYCHLPRCHHQPGLLVADCRQQTERQAWSHDTAQKGTHSLPSPQAGGVHSASAACLPTLCSARTAHVRGQVWAGLRGRRPRWPLSL